MRVKVELLNVQGPRRIQFVTRKVWWRKLLDWLHAEFFGGEVN